MKIWKLCLVWAGICFLAAGCGNGKENGTAVHMTETGTVKEDKVSQKPSVTDFPIEYEENGEVVFLADVNHDGREDRIYLGLSGFNERGSGTVQVLDGMSETVLWERSYAKAHAGWTMLYLYRENGQDYILEYNPAMYQGRGDYRYEIFHLDEQGNPVILKEEETSFQLYENNNGVYKNGFFGDAEEYHLFLEHVNSCIDQSLLLISSDNGDIVYSTPEQPIIVYHEENIGYE